MFFRKRPSRNVQTLQRQVVDLEAERDTLQRQLRVTEAERDALAEVVARDRERVRAETASYARQSAENLK